MTTHIGDGVHARRKGYMRSHLEESRIFPSIIGKMDANRRDLFRESRRELRQPIHER